MELNTLIQRMPFEEYARIGMENNSLRASMLQAGRISMAHMKARIDSADEPTEAMEFGKHFHSFIEDPSAFESRVKIIPEFSGMTRDGKESTRSAAAKEKKQEWFADLPEDAIALTAQDHHAMNMMLERLKSQTKIFRMLQNATREVSLFVEDPETGLMMQCRFDALAKEGYVADFKTTLCADKKAFIHEIFGQRRFYILQAAHYVHCAKLAGMSKADYFVFIPCEKQAPFGVSGIPVDHAMLEVGETVRARVAREYAEALVTDKWPCYPDEFSEISIPGYVQYDDSAMFE